MKWRWPNVSSRSSCAIGTPRSAARRHTAVASLTSKVIRTPAGRLRCAGGTEEWPSATRASCAPGASEAASETYQSDSQATCRPKRST